MGSTSCWKGREQKLGAWSSLSQEAQTRERAVTVRTEEGSAQGSSWKRRVSKAACPGPAVPLCLHTLGWCVSGRTCSGPGQRTSWRSRKTGQCSVLTFRRSRTFYPSGHKNRAALYRTTLLHVQWKIQVILRGDCGCVCLLP